MPLLENCCCGLALSSAVIGVYLTIAYAIAFILEMWWILEATEALPFPSYLLCLGYFIQFIFSALLLHGLSVKRSRFLLVWMFVLGLLLGPEAGLVLYISIHFWRITSLYGLVEVTCWACRLLVNVAGIACVQSLNSQWRTEKDVLKRLHQLKMSQVPKMYDGMRRFSVANRIQGYENHSYHPSYEKDVEKRDIGRYEAALPYHEPLHTFTEFNASTFNPQDLLQPPPMLHVAPQETAPLESPIIPKTRSLIDLREADFNNSESLRSNNDETKSISLNYNNNLSAKDKKPGNQTQSLDRRILNNKNLKILKKLSPFLNKKSSDDEVNVYRVNPPKAVLKGVKGDTNWDSQLNKVFSRRGMYVYDDKTRKVVYYPPEMVDKSVFRGRAYSHGSTLSRSSGGSSDDVRHISDVAL